MSENKYKLTELADEGGGPRKSGMTVPEGYFESFAAKMMERIPAEEPRVVEMPRHGFWQKVRPYVYMAAMFAGIWLMMNMFTLFGPAKSPAQSNSQVLLAELASSEQSSGYIADYVSDSGDYGFYDDLYDSGFDIPENL